MAKDRITLFISRDGAARAARSTALGPLVGPNGDYDIRPCTLRDDDTGHLERGFRVVLLNAAGHVVGSL